MFNFEALTTFKLEEIKKLETDILTVNSKIQNLENNFKSELNEKVEEMKNELFQGILNESEFFEDNLLIKHLGHSLQSMNKSS